MFLFFLHSHKSYLLLSVCLIGRNLGRLCQDGVCSVLSVLFDHRCKRKAGVLCHFTIHDISSPSVLREVEKLNRMNQKGRNLEATILGNTWSMQSFSDPFQALKKERSQLWVLVIKKKQKSKQTQINKQTNNQLFILTKCLPIILTAVKCWPVACWCLKQISKVFPLSV